MTILLTQATSRKRDKFRSRQAGHVAGVLYSNPGKQPAAESLCKGVFANTHAARN
jgi:hypothetical protein